MEAFKELSMALSHRQKVTIIALALYWPAIFIATHIPQVPRWIIQIGFSDKTLHYLVYLVLIFLLWFAISPYKKVDWRKAKVWWVLLMVVWYGVLDEVLQGYVGRSPDVMDFFADLAGTLTGLALLTIFHFWPASLAITGSTIFALVNLAETNPADILPVTNATFYFFAYGFFSILWFRYMHRLLPLRAPELKWLIGVSALPIGLLISVESFSALAGNSLEPARLIASAAGILSVAAVIFLIAIVCLRFTKKESPYND